MDLLDRLLGHDYWTTSKLFEICGSLTDEQVKHEFDIGHRSVQRTFDHIVWNAECWTDLMMQRTVRERITDSSIQELEGRYRLAMTEFTMQARITVDSNRLNDCFVDTLNNPPREKSCGGVIVHLATHGMHHRAQLLYMLRRLGIEELPEGDALTWECQQS